MLEMTDDERNLLLAWRAMDLDHQKEMLLIMQDIASVFPGRPALRLVHSADVNLRALHSIGHNT